jgi:hypothetical protein
MAMRRYGGWVAASSCWLLAVWTSHRRLLHVDEGTGRAVGCNGRMGLAVEPEGQGGEAEGHGADGWEACSQDTAPLKGTPIGVCTSTALPPPGGQTSRSRPDAIVSCGPWRPQ